MSLMLINDETYGHDVKSINKHRDKTFEDKKSNLYVLSKTLDGCPPFYEAYGPFLQNFQGITPRLLIDGQHYFGDAKSWQWAEKKFREVIAKKIEDIDEWPKHREPKV
jgi:hypothetical protein